MNITKINTSSYHPQTDGLTERFNRTLINIISKYVDRNQDDWDNHLQLALYAYRTAVHSSTQFSPFELVFGRLPTLPIDQILQTARGLQTKLHSLRN